MKGKLILPGSPEAPNIFLPKEVAERIQRRMDGKPPLRERKVGSSTADFDALRRAEDRRRRKRLKNLLLKRRLK